METVAEGTKYQKLHRKFLKDFRALADDYREQFYDLIALELKENFGKVKKTMYLNKIKGFDDLPNLKEKNICVVQGDIAIAIACHIFSSDEAIITIRVRNIKNKEQVYRTLKIYDFVSVADVVNKIVKRNKKLLGGE